MWLNSLGHLWTGSALIALMIAMMGVMVSRMDRTRLRTILRQMAPTLWLCGAAMVAIVLTEVSSWLGAPRSVQFTLLALVVVASAAFLLWGSLAATRRVWIASRIGKTTGARPKA